VGLIAGWHVSALFEPVGHRFAAVSQRSMITRHIAMGPVVECWPTFDYASMIFRGG